MKNEVKTHEYFTACNTLGIHPGAPRKIIEEARDRLKEKYADDYIMIEGISKAYSYLMQPFFEEDRKKANNLAADRQTKSIFFGILKFIAFVSLIPLSIFLWNIHPVLGIFSIAFTCWIAWAVLKD